MTVRGVKTTFLSVYFTFFIDNLSWAVVFPIFAPYFLNTQNSLFPEGTSVGTRSMILGFFLMAFSLGQFFGAPLIGEYADKHGRKKALLLSVFFTLIGLCVSAYSMGIYSLVWLFIGRLLTGLFASNTTVCLSCISDLSESEKTRLKRFGTLSMLAGLSFIIGAFVGGQISDPTVNSHFSASLPLWLAAALTLFNFLFIIFGFDETFRVDPKLKFHFFEAFHHIKMALEVKSIKRIYTVYFFFIFSWMILFQFVPVLVVEKFAFSGSGIGTLALFMGACWAIGSGYLNQFLVHHFDSKLVLELCLIGFTIFCGIVVVPTHIYGTIGLVGTCVLLGSIAWPLCTGLISNAAPKRIQGKILGLSQSVQSLAMTVCPVVGGLAFHYSLSLPFFIAAFVSLVAFIIYYFILKHHQA